MKIYVLHPGYVESRTDHQEHFIDSQQLAGLYGVNWRDECFIDNGTNTFPYSSFMIHLWPSREGIYLRPCEPGAHAGTPAAVRLLHD